LDRLVGDNCNRKPNTITMVDTRSQSRGRTQEREHPELRGRGNSNEQRRRRAPSTPAQFRFLPPHYIQPRETEREDANEEDSHEILIPTGNQAPQTPASGDNGNPQQVARGVPDQQQPIAQTTNQTTQETPAIAEAQLGQVYKDIFNSLTLDQKIALLRGRVHLPPNPSHNLRASADGPGRGMFTDGGERVESRAISRIIPMRPLDVGRDWALDYTSSQTIKLYNKATEAVKGDAFDGKYLYSWLARVHDKARAYSWLPILTINGKVLTKSYADISIDG
jgi:hypothetical protein